MPPPSYPHRHLLLTELLAAQPPPPPDSFAVPHSADNERGRKLDALLLANWSAPRRALDHDILQHAESLRLKRNDFDVLGRVGEGQFGVVDAVRCKLDGKVYAMKTIEKSMAQRAGSQLGLAYERHLHALGDATCPIPALATTFQSPSSLHLVTAYAPCGSLWDRLCEALPTPGLDTGRMAEDEVAWWARQMVSAIAWVHDHGYAHRDVKPHNFLLHADGRLWLTDFGSAAPLSDGCVARRHCLLPAGTPDYVAPEVLRLAEDAMVEAAQSIDESMDRTAQELADLEAPGYMADVDWWSLGATLYEMAVGRAPFWAPSIGATYELVMRCDLRMPEHLSPGLKSLLSGLLSPHDVRLGSSGVAEVRSHSFFSGDVRAPPAPQAIDLDSLAESFIHDLDSGAFDHLFDASASTISAVNSISHSRAPSPALWSRWVGWSLDPPADYFGDEPPAASPQRPSPAMFTPRRGPSDTPIPRTAPRSVPRTRPVSERRAFAELVQCVQASARKKIARTQPPNSASTMSSTGSPWRKEQPPTPTPMSREVSALHRQPLSRPSSRGGSEEPPATGSWGRAGPGLGSFPGSRPSSRSGSRSTQRDDTLLARLAAVSDASGSRSGSSTASGSGSGSGRGGRRHTRTGSHQMPLQSLHSKDDTFLLRLQSPGSSASGRGEKSRTESREDTPLAKFSVARIRPLEVEREEAPANEWKGREGTPGRAEVVERVSRPVLGEERRQRRVADTRADDVLARLVGMGEDPPERKGGPARERGLGHSALRAAIARKPQREEREHWHGHRSAPQRTEQEQYKDQLDRDHKHQRDHDRQGRDVRDHENDHRSLEAWHASLDVGISSLERRLAEMTARLAVAI